MCVPAKSEKINSTAGIDHWTEVRSSGKKLKSDWPRHIFVILEHSHDMEVVWRSVWETGKINLENETEYLRIFSSTLERLFEERKPAIGNLSHPPAGRPGSGTSASMT
jgi:hypothetical protein